MMLYVAIFVRKTKFKILKNFIKNYDLIKVGYIVHDVLYIISDRKGICGNEMNAFQPYPNFMRPDLA